MITAITITNDLDEKKLLAVKIYSEFMAALEDLGALCLAVRQRDEGVGIVYNYLTYETRNIKQIFELAQNGNGLTIALRLPSLDEIIQQSSDLNFDMLAKHYKECNVFLAQAGTTYLFNKNRVYIRAYNKTKHGFVVVHDRHTFQAEDILIVPDTSWIVDKNSEYKPANPKDTPVVELVSVELKNVGPILENIITIRSAIMTICELTAELLERKIITSADTKA